MGTIIDNDLPASPTFAIRTEGTISINGNSNFDSNPLDINDDARIYAGKRFTFNGMICPFLYYYPTFICRTTTESISKK